MLYNMAKDLIVLYENNTEQDYRMNSLTGSPDLLKNRQIYRCCQEAGWYILQGLVASGLHRILGDT